MSIWDYKITHTIDNIWSMVFSGRVIRYTVMYLIVFVMLTISDYHGWKQAENTYHFDGTPEYVSISVQNCTITTLRETGAIYHVKDEVTYSKGPDCAFIQQNYSNILSKHDNKARGISDSTNYNVYGFVFLFFVIFVTINTDKMKIINHPKKVFASICFNWLIVAALLFPVTYNSYRSTTAFTLDNASVTVSDIAVVENGEKWIFRPRTFMGQLSYMSGTKAKPFN